MRRLTWYETERLERMLENWVRSKQGSAVGCIAMSSTFDDGIQGRTADYQCRIPVLQADAELIDEIVDGRPATQLRPALPRMPDVWREPLRLFYLEQSTQRQIARLLKITQPNVSRRLHAARLYLVRAIFYKCDSAGSRPSA